MEPFISNLFSNPKFYVCWLVAIVVSICIHEICHAWCAYTCGDKTAYKLGFMTLNPLKVMGNTSLLCLVLFGICWGKVPVMTAGLDRRERAAIAAAGPFSNLLLAVVFAVLFRLWLHFSVGDEGQSPIYISRLYAYFLQLACYANCLLFAFNILPIPALDGWAILEAFVPYAETIPARARTIYSTVAIIILFFTPLSGIFTKACRTLAMSILP